MKSIRILLFSLLILAGVHRVAAQNLFMKTNQRESYFNGATFDGKPLTWNSTLNCYVGTLDHYANSYTVVIAGRSSTVYLSDIMPIIRPAVGAALFFIQGK